MVTRPLDLLSKLQPAPRSFDALYFVNAGLIGLFFVLFGSRFVVSPGIVVRDGGTVRDLQVPIVASATDTAVATSLVISVAGRDLVFTDEGKYTFAELPRWLRARMAEQKDARLLVRADAAVTLSDLAEIHEAARSAGFTVVQFAAESVTPIK